MRQAILVSAAAILSWSALIAISRILLVRFGFDPWAYTFLQLCAGGLCLLAIGGKGRLSLASFRRPSTWILGVLRVLSAALFTAVLVWVSAMEAGVLGAVNVPMVAVAVWLVLGRRPARLEWLGHAVILASIAPLVMTLEGGIANPAVILMLLNEVCLVAGTLLAERHPDNSGTEPGSRARFTGAVLLVTAGLFLVLRILEDGGVGEVDWSAPLIVSAVLVGVFLRGPSMFLTFWSTRLIGSQNYMACCTALPVIGMALEQAAFGLGLIDVTRFRPETVSLTAGVVAGTLIVVAIRVRAARRRIGAVA
ncbi:EamA family transporter [Thalassobaculum salexigens]|uniref:EamA family transporter n=1 Tax=Thalassobaculum salexigens TaxID=455360 RepID=UPI00041EA89B|nr:EamA family transporter [Thalassobaculum salexigens]